MKSVVWVVAIVFAWSALGCKKEPDSTISNTTASTTAGATTASPTTTGITDPNAKPADALKELKIEDVKVGTGRPAEKGDILVLQYTGKLKDGKVFDSNDKKDATPFAVKLGDGTVIKGWEQGLIGIKNGGERKLSIPSELGYGERGQVNMGQTEGGIPPYADLFFDIKVLALVKKDEEGVYDKTDVKVGSGPACKKGDKIQVDYVGTFANGKKFDSSRDRHAPLEFVLGANTVIAAWDYGIVGMKVGGIRKLRVPPAIAYGAQGNPPTIGPNQVLDFEVELLKIIPQPTAR